MVSPGQLDCRQQGRGWGTCAASVSPHGASAFLISLQLVFPVAHLLFEGQLRCAALSHTCARERMTGVDCPAGQCGTGSAVTSVPGPTVVESLGPIKCTGVAAGMGHTVVCTDAGDALGFGMNQDGQLGNASTQSAMQVRERKGS
jgi:hypothetical protein